VITCDYYNHAMRPATMRSIAEGNASRLRQMLEGAQPVFCFSGMSGTAHAYALAYAYGGDDFGMMYVRKDGESRNSCRSVEFHIPDKGDARRRVLVFVDDLISSGTTLDRTISGALRTMRLERGDFERTVYFKALGGSSNAICHEPRVARCDLTRHLESQHEPI
jgi:orotate phosphoribosyltransferase